jgi:UPI00017B5489 related cluster
MRIVSHSSVCVSCAEFAKEISDFSIQEILPLVSEMDKKAEIDIRLVKSLFLSKIMSIEIPIEYGGLGYSFAHTIAAIEEISKVDPGIAVFVDVHNTLVIGAINKWGTDLQKQLYLPKLATNVVGAFSLTEHHAGSDAYSLSCEARKHGDGYIISGKKHWTTNAREAGLFILLANVIEDSCSYLTAFIIDDPQSLKILPSADKMGIRASSTCDIEIDNLFVPQKNILGGVGSGKRIILELLTDGRVGIAAQMLGLARGVFHMANEYAQTRKQFGKVIANYQGIHFELARMATRIEATQGLLEKAIKLKSDGDFMKYFKIACMAKLYSSETAEYIASKGIEILGGEGYMKTSLLEKMYRDAKIGTIYEGTSNILLKTIAKLILKTKISD